MRWRAMTRAVFAAAAAAVSGSGCDRARPYDLVISGAAIVDTVTGDAAVKTIGLRDGAIAYVGDDPATGVVEVNAKGLWAVPGLWDMHAHISDASFFSLFVANGIVGVRDMGGGAERPTDGCESINIATLRAWRDEIENGARLGPRLVLAGPVASGAGAPTALAAATPEDARAAVRAIDEAGADFVKVYEDIPPAAFAALAAEASDRGLVFAGHVSEETLAIDEAIAAGQRSVEHVRAHLLLCFARTDDEREALFVADDWSADDRAWATRHSAACPAVWRALREDDVWLTPTLAVQETLITGEAAGFEDDPRRAALPEAIRQATRQRSLSLRGRSETERQAALLWNEYIFRLVARAREEKARVLAGSDAACEGVIPGYGLHRELQLLVDAGFSPLESLQTATVEAGRYFEKEHLIGRLAEGFHADIVLVRGDPRSDISMLEEIDTVILRGEIAYSVR